MRVGGDHLQEAVRTSASPGPVLEGPIDRPLVDRDRRHRDVAAVLAQPAADAGRVEEPIEQVVAVLELRQRDRIPEVRHLDVPVPGEDQILGEPELHLDRHVVLERLQPVTNGDVSKINSLGQPHGRHLRRHRRGECHVCLLGMKLFRPHTTTPAHGGPAPRSDGSEQHRHPLFPQEADHVAIAAPPMAPRAESPEPRAVLRREP